MVTRILIILLALTLSASAQRICPPNQVNRNGLVGRWLVPGKQTGNVATPTLCLDDSGKGNHGTVVSNANYGVIFSRPAMTFNGSSQYVSIANNATWAGLTGAMSISVWVKIAGTANYPTIVTKGTTGMWTLRVQSAVAGTIYWGNSTAGNTTTATFNDGNWHNIVATYNGSGTNAGLLIYVDGVLKATTTDGTFTGFTTNATNVSIGAIISGNYFNGSIDDVRVYTRAISAAEVKAIYMGEN